MARTISALVVLLSLTAVASPPKKRAPPRRSHVDVCSRYLNHPKRDEAVVILYERKSPELPESLITAPKSFR